MKNRLGWLMIAFIWTLSSCGRTEKDYSQVVVYDIADSASKIDSAKNYHPGREGRTTQPLAYNRQQVDTKNTNPDAIVNYAETLIGVPYKYASTDPAEGFDCSGFITYVYNHFDIAVPRSSVDFTDVGIEVPQQQARRGDLILFTGTDSTVRIVGHMGIVTENRDTLKFIHATSGKQYSVTITPLSDYYKGRFVKVIRLG